MRLLVTRPREDAEAFAAILRGRGHEAVIAPLLELRFMPGGEIPLLNFQAVLASSANGIRGFAARSSQRNLPVYVVGPQTAEAARHFGFANVISADGDAAALIAKVAESTNPADGKLLHAAGTETAGRIKQGLEAHGYQVEAAILYEAVPAESLPANAGEALRTDMLDGVLMFSPRTARVFAALAAKDGLAEHCQRLEAFCISVATAEALSPLVFARLAVAGSPNQAAMLDLLPSG
ncbi:MAG: uroporphyrinogen-III synthase [Alphaproteobacteria bacterium]|nr:uroporphyrinogen-III synthase [Alphaproteobacteria bacterium]